MIVDKIKKRERAVNKKKTNVDIPVGKWIKCDNCKEILYKDTLRENLHICPNCGHYFRMHIGRRLELMIDEGTYTRFDLRIDTTNPLELEDYNKKLKSFSQQLRKNMTPEERHLWYDFLKLLPMTVNRQKVIYDYIVDFYIASHHIVIELDGSQHLTDDAMKNDKERDLILNELGIKVLRYKNTDINTNFYGVCRDICDHLGLLNF